ncbi:hypothetical protein [Micromonospora peucetia]|uniref:Uncharacterized protein n=1 Tax=Micromonospora peucetia TaxID=47871 RepID=A0ABZ1E5K1_9ACTN|nr:hypothetical protein [Micromonospora peucetia]WSA30037.1 hypothetical protein OIE14_17605 [Micromonospora peucetia]
MLFITVSYLQAAKTLPDLDAGADPGTVTPARHETTQRGTAIAGAVHDTRKFPHYSGSIAGQSL